MKINYKKDFLIKLQPVPVQQERQSKFQIALDNVFLVLTLEK